MILAVCIVAIGATASTTASVIRQSGSSAQDYVLQHGSCLGALGTGLMSERNFDEVVMLSDESCCIAHTTA